MWDGVTPIHIVLGKDGLYGLRNRDRIPLGGLIQLRNATLEDGTLRTGGGAAKLGSAISGTPDILCAIDYWPNTAQQRTVVMADDGAIYKDDGSGGSWASMVSGLSTSNIVPWFTVGGEEIKGNSRLLFYADGVNRPRVMTADGAAFNLLSKPAPEWTGVNNPRAFVIHEGYNWAFGALDAPHLLYRSLNTDHQDFTTTPFAVPIFSGQGEYLAGGISFKGGLLLYKYPEGAYWYDTRDADTTQWRAYRIGAGGIPGQGCAILLGDTVLSIDHAGGLAITSATTATGAVAVENIAYRKLGRFIPDQVNRAALATAVGIYYSDKQQVMIACAALGQSVKNRRLVLDLNAKGEVGERWLWDDRDVNQALFLRKDSGVLRPAIGDDAGQIWKLDQAGRTKDGSGYTFEWWLADSDFDQIVPGWSGKLKNLYYVQALYDPRSAASHSLQVWRDGRLRQTISLSLSGGSVTVPVTIPFTLGPETMLATAPRRLRGQARRLSFRGLSTENNIDVSIAGLVIGAGLAGGT